MRNKAMTLGTAVAILAISLSIGGYISNLIELTKTDFEAPYKAEIIRTTGVIIPPIGVVLGYVKIED